VALTPQNSEAFMREVDDAVRQDQLLTFWQRYGRALAVLLIVGLAAFGGWLYWQHYSKTQSEAVSEQMDKMLATAVGGGTPDAKDVDALAKASQPGYRDLALIRQTTIEFDALKPQQVVDRLKPLAVEGAPWFGSAGELVAIAYMKMRKPELAGPMFAAMAKDENVPQSIRSRARQMAGLLGIDAVETPAEPVQG